MNVNKPGILRPSRQSGKMTISTLPKTMPDLTKTAWTEVTCASRLGLNVTEKGSPPYREEGSVSHHNKTPKFLPVHFYTLQTKPSGAYDMM